MAADEESAELHSTFFTMWAELIIHHRWSALFFLALVTLGAMHQVSTRLVIDHSIDHFAPPNSPEIKHLHDFRDTFGRADPLMLLIEGDLPSHIF